MKHVTQTIIVALIFALLLAACGGETSTTKPETSAGTSANVSAETPKTVTAEKPTAEPTSAEEEPIKLTWLILEFWNPDTVIPAYEKLHPNIEIEAEKVGFGDLLQQNQIRLGAGGGTPDIVSVDEPLVASYGARGWLYPLDGVITDEDKAGWVDASVTAGTYNGKFLAAPQHTSTQLLYLNLDLLKAAGVTPPGVDDRWTWEQVMEAAQAVKTDEVWGFNWEQSTAPYQLLPLPLSLGGKAIGDDGFTVDGIINSDEWVQAFTFYGDAYNALGVAPKSDNPSSDIFASGNLAMFLGGPWNIRRFASDGLDFNWAVSRHPYFEGGKIVTPTGSWHFGVNASSQHPEAAAEFVRWLTIGDGASLWWSKDSYELPAQKAFLASFSTEPEFQKPPLSYLATAADEATVNPVPRPVTPGYLEYEQLLKTAFDDIRKGADPKEALDTAVTRITAEMAKYQQ